VPELAFSNTDVEIRSSIVYRTEVLVRFADCDPAGMVFYPRYMEMFNNLVEDWCQHGLDLSFAELHAHRGWGLPTVHLEADFVAPSFLGEILNATITLRNLGTRSIGLGIQFDGPDGALRVRGRVVLVLMDLRTKQALALPPDIRARIQASRESD
jgi:4-hydroxybenzoyl-CoA thioesterase